MSKTADAPYHSDRNEGSLKIKPVQRGKFPVIGFIKDPSGVAALYLGKQREGPGLHRQGRYRLVANGLRPNKQAAQYGSSPKAKLTKPIKKPKATWVEPQFFADVEYRDITSEEVYRRN